VLHLVNGDAVIPEIRRSGLPGEFAVWGDVLWEGPLVADATPEERIAQRARYFSWPENQPHPTGELALLWHRNLLRAAQHDEVVLWLEHDLHDQFQLIHHLDWFARQPHPALRLICIGAFPGVVPFHGLGQLDAAQLGSLFPTRRAVTTAELVLGQRAWQALVSRSPLGLEALLFEDTHSLPFLGGAIRRFLQEYPETGTGLSRTERMILDGIFDGPRTARELFLAVQRREERVFMGDSSFWRILWGLSQGPKPLLRIEADIRMVPGLPPAPVTITEPGRQVLAGNADRVGLNGVDRWLGGVHLQGTSTPWRWDPATERIR
jgi:hypothetical protein